MTFGLRFVIESCFFVGFGICMQLCISCGINKVNYIKEVTYKRNVIP